MLGSDHEDIFSESGAAAPGDAPRRASSADHAQTGPTITVERGPGPVRYDEVQFMVRHPLRKGPIALLFGEYVYVNGRLILPDGYRDGGRMVLQMDGKVDITQDRLLRAGKWWADQWLLGRPETIVSETKVRDPQTGKEVEIWEKRYYLVVDRRSSGPTRGGGAQVAGTLGIMINPRLLAHTGSSRPDDREGPRGGDFFDGPDPQRVAFFQDVMRQSVAQGNEAVLEQMRTMNENLRRGQLDPTELAALTQAIRDSQHGQSEVLLAVVAMMQQNMTILAGMNSGNQQDVARLIHQNQQTLERLLDQLGGRQQPRRRGPRD